MKARSTGRAAFAAGMLLAALAPSRARAESPDCDFFCYMTEANKASLVMLEERKIVPTELAGRIALGIEQVAREQDAAGANRGRGRPAGGGCRHR